MSQEIRVPEVSDGVTEGTVISIAVAVGDKVKAGDFIGRVGNSGVSQVPHIHFNLMDGDQWIDAKGVPALFSRFEKIRMGGQPLAFDLGNPITDWLVRPIG